MVRSVVRIDVWLIVLWSFLIAKFCTGNTLVDDSCTV